MLTKPLDRLVFLDIESTTQYHTFADMPTRMKALFEKRFQKEIEEFKKAFPIVLSNIHNPEVINIDITENGIKACEAVYDLKGPLFPEFNKIICISLGVIDITNPKEYKLKTKSFCGEDEKKILQDFISSASIAKFNDSKPYDRFSFVAHNGMIFDFPVIAKRLIYNQMDLPVIFDYCESKPWEVTHFIDTKNIWKWGVYDGNVSLDMLAGAFDVESSKTLMTGDAVKNVYYLLKDLKAIQDYCEHDVFTLASIYLKMKNIQIPLTR